MQNSKPVLQLPANIFVIGCGGVASYLLPCLLKLCKGGAVITLVDGDKLEMKNLDRQLFRENQIGMNKAEALKDVIGNPDCIRVVPHYFSFGSVPIPEGSLIFCCADNHAARLAVLNTADEKTACAIIGGNEYTDAEAYYYEWGWKESELDPRVYYKEITTDKTDDPTRPASCTGVWQDATPQLALANFSAANHMLWHFWYYYAEARHLDRETIPYFPVRHWNSFGRFGTELIKDKKEKYGTHEPSPEAEANH